MRSALQSCDAQRMKDVLVAYASKHGSTAEIACRIAETLSRSGLSVDCREVSQVGATQAYEAVVLGSAVYLGRWRAEARHFLRVHRKALAEQSLWVFSSGPVGPDTLSLDSPLARPRRTGRAVERLGAREHIVFGGSLPAQPDGRIAQAMVRRTTPEQRDRRDWEQIHAWALHIAQQLDARPGAHAARRRSTLLREPARPIAGS